MDALSSPVLVSILDCGQQLGVHDEPPGQQHGRDGGDGQHRVDRDHDGDQEAEIELREVGLQRLAVQRQVGQPHRGVAQLDRAHDQELVAEARRPARTWRRPGPGEGVRPRADRAPAKDSGNWRNSRDAAP